MYVRQESEYYRAKLKAARRIGQGWVKPCDLPSNREIRDQIQSFARLHEGDHRTDDLRAMRIEALRVMRLLRAWDELAGYPLPPQACLVNFYEPTAKMGLHQDRDEQDFAAPVLSLSLGDTAVFRIGGTVRGGKTISLKLASGDALAFGGEARLAYHGIDRILAGSSSLLPQAGRVNLTLRRVTKTSG